MLCREQARNAFRGLARHTSSLLTSSSPASKSSTSSSSSSSCGFRRGIAPASRASRGLLKPALAALCGAREREWVGPCVLVFSLAWGRKPKVLATRCTSHRLTDSETGRTHDTREAPQCCPGKGRSREKHCSIESGRHNRRRDCLSKVDMIRRREPVFKDAAGAQEALKNLKHLQQEGTNRLSPPAGSRFEVISSSTHHNTLSPCCCCLMAGEKLCTARREKPELSTPTKKSPRSRGGQQPACVEQTPGAAETSAAPRSPALERLKQLREQGATLLKMQDG